MNTTKQQPQFEPNAFYEKLGALRATNPQAFASLSPTSKIVLGQYEAQKREHARLQALRGESEDAGSQELRFKGLLVLHAAGRRIMREVRGEDDGRS